MKTIANNPVIASAAKQSRLDCHVATLLAMTMLALAACQPTVKVEAPDKPIEINLNVNIEHKIKVEIEKDVKKAITNNPDIF